jgi:tetrahydromethanopterin S-methyltransferase subunit F
VRTRKSLNGRIIKTILFVFITKTLIGVSLEVPYDLFVSGAVAWTPLLANISFPIIYMLAISARISTPSRTNTDVVAGYIERILYDTGTPVVYQPKRRISSGSLRTVFTGVYAIGFVGSLVLLLWLLRSLQFNVVNGMIFFLFLSAVSFLGVRLRQSAHELAMLDEREGVLNAFADFLSTPFVRVGQWLSDKYAKANIVTTILDLAIEMPIKTSLRLLRQWVSFMRDKQEEL